MALDNYAWWRQRFVRMAQYFDAYRIDHILGFFRIWEIPTSQFTGLLGHFYPALPLSKEELASHGLRDLERLIHPYIRRSHLEQQFGAALEEKVPHTHP
jgi:4-alpha-glucanotransferase